MRGLEAGEGWKEVEESSEKGRQRRERNTNRSKQYSSRTFCLTWNKPGAGNRLLNKNTVLRGRKPV